MTIPGLCKSHQVNDKTVMQTYGFWGKFDTESKCVFELMKMKRLRTKHKPQRN